MRSRKRIKVILDTNIWISYLISDRLSFIDSLISSNRITLVFSDELLEEFVTVAQRPKLKKYFTDEDLVHLLKLLSYFGIILKPKSRLTLCRDAKDNFLLNLAMDANANYLVTGDQDLLNIKTIGHCKIITLNDFAGIASKL